LALKADRRARAALVWRESADERERIDRLLEIIRLTAVRHRLAGSLSHGQRQWLEIGMLLAQEPKLLLVDEPVAGMTARSRRQGDVFARRLGAGRRHDRSSLGE
jgi:urea transport system ATP-binding protein